MLAATRSLRVFTAGSGIQARAFHQHNVAAAGGLFGRLFGRKKEEPTRESAGAEVKDVEAKGAKDGATDFVEQDVQGERIHEEMEREYAERAPFVPKFPKRDYTPARLEQRLRRVLDEAQVTLDSDWTATSLADKETKIKVLTGVIVHMKLPVSNRVLNNVRTVGDLLRELSEKPLSKDAGHPVAAFYAEKADELPSNMKFEPFAKGSRKLHVHK